jgi:dimethylargininase
VSAALVRPPSPRLADAELTHLEARPIDPGLAAEQHRGYVALLERLGLDVVALPPLDDHPDGVFVEDVVVVVGDLAIITRPGAATRRGEVAGLEAVLAARGLRTAAIEAPGTLDGGDVLQVGDSVFVGQSTRTNVAGPSSCSRCSSRAASRSCPSRSPARCT